jgi:MOSC domain-containing protein YiiM
VEVTGLRDPCSKLDKLRPGLMKATLERDADGKLIRKAGVMSVVLAGGELRAGDTIGVELPAGEHVGLEPL